MSALASPSSSIQPHDLSVYQDFVDCRTARDDDVVLNVDKATATVSGQAVTSGFQKLYRWLFGQNKSAIVEDFSAALEAKYGKDVASFAFSDEKKQQALNAGLSKSMIKQVIENASFVERAQNDIENYADMARTNITLAQEACPEKDLIKEDAILREKFSTVQQFAGRSLKQFGNINALNEALTDAITVATTSIEVIKEAALRAKLKSLEIVAHSSQEAATAAAQEISSIKEKLIIDLEKIEPDQLLIRDTSPSLPDTGAIRYAMQQTARTRNQQIENQNRANILTRARVQCEAAAAMAPQQTILTEARCAEYLYSVTQIAHELATANKEVSAVTTNMVASAEQKVALAHTILAHATAAEEAAKKIAATPSAEIREMMMATQIFYVAEQAKLMALSPNNAIETLNLKKELEKIHSSLAQLTTSPELHHDHATFLLAEARSPEEAAAVAQGIARALSQASVEMQESAANTKKEIPLAEPEKQEGLTALFQQQQETARLLQQATSCYAMLSCCKEIETHRTLFHEELTTLRGLPLDDSSALADFTTIEGLISKEEISFPTLNIDHLEDQEQSAKIIGLNGKITTAPADYSPTREDFKDGINLVQLSIAQKFGIDAVTRFNQNFEAKIQAKNPLTIGDLAAFITKEKLTGAAIYFITPVSSLEELRDQLEDVDDYKIIRSDSRVDDFNPFDQNQPPLSATAHTQAQSNQAGINKARKIILGAIESKEENPLEVKTMEDLFTKLIRPDEKTKKGEPFTVGELKKFLAEAILLRGPLAYQSRHFKRYLRTERAAESFSDTVAWHATGLTTASALDAAGKAVFAHTHLLAAVEPTTFVLGLLTYLGANALAPYLFRPAESSAGTATTHHH